ncbi:hypothetical protein BCR41DRAFT_356460 [Lobosporangium transversale]|uniref:Uncharacterized protein n=1 Tax=Lobosporangium transversale TaxID=64571 RepID=A0A1Y2GIU9_9FUNG|nr:hypothetical protein BCR41DRAFT_356460 [Lobosporangium transversale]ORZ12081.1 hypothetical protein BCR41DRAFT_356460 [Lobosporangium transversale]|eukprot:XP_021879946.1 hypothetical protein BCR41DRAFT_356460 [Lobosporangium transversale]
MWASPSNFLRRATVLKHSTRDLLLSQQIHLTHSHWKLRTQVKTRKPQMVQRSNPIISLPVHPPLARPRVPT